MQVHYQSYSPFPMIKQALDFLTYPSKIRGFVGLIFSENHDLVPLQFSASVLGKTSREVTIHELGRRRINRRRYSYDTNTTIARSLELPVQDPPKDKPINHLDISFLERPRMRDAIGDHAYRRVMLFYYLAIAYYKSGCVITRGKTLLQHGKSNFDWSSAAHSSILPNVCDDFFDRLKEKLSEEGVTDRTRQILETVGVSTEKILQIGEGALREREIELLLFGVDTGKGLLNSQSTFYNNLNSTVELPHRVNEFDTVIEGVMREKGLQTLNRVSQEGLHPHKALSEFVSEMHAFFKKSEETTKEKIELLKKTQTLEQQLWYIEKHFSEGLLQEYLKTAHKVGQCYRKLYEIREYTIYTNLKGRLTWQKNYFSPGVKVSGKNFRQIAKLLKSTPEWFPNPVEELINPLQYSLKIIELQKRTTILPPLELLSGKLVHDTLVPLTEEELFEQRLILIRRV